MGCQERSPQIGRRWSHHDVKCEYMATPSVTAATALMRRIARPSVRVALSCHHMSKPEKLQKHMMNAIKSTITAQNQRAFVSPGYPCGLKIGRPIRNEGLRRIRVGNSGCRANGGRAGQGFHDVSLPQRREPRPHVSLGPTHRTSNPNTGHHFTIRFET